MIGMMQNIKINPYQFLVLVTLFSMGTSILIIPSVLANEAKQDAWIVAIVGTGIGLVVVWLFCIIALWFPHLTFVQVNEKILGKWLGKAVSLLFISMSFIYSASLLFYAGSFLNTHMMPNTPLGALNFLMVFIIVLGVYYGLETIARSAEVLILFFLILFLILVLFISPEVQFELIQPVFETGARTIIQSTIPFIETISVNAIVLLMIFPACVNKIKQAKTAFFIGNLIGSSVMIIITFLCISVLGPDNTARAYYPGYELAQRINVGDFIQRIEGLMAGLWIITLYFKATLYFYVSVVGMAQIFNLKNYRPLTIPLGILVLIFSIVMYPNVVYQQNWNATTGLILSCSVGLFLPLLLVVVYVIRKKQWKKEA